MIRTCERLRTGPPLAAGQRNSVVRKRTRISEEVRGVAALVNGVVTGRRARYDRDMRWRSARGVVLVLSWIAAAVPACGAFTSADPPGAEWDAGAPPDGSPPATDGAPPDGVAPREDGGGATLALPCPRPRGPSGPLASSERRRLHDPGAGVRLPWGITTDRDHVFWVTQPATTQGYNGEESGAIWRVARNGFESAVKLAEAQPRTTVLARDGDHVYWFTLAGAKLALRRVPRDAACASACPPPDEIGTFSTGSPVVKIVRVAPGVLFAITSTGTVLRADLSARVIVGVGQSAIYPTLTTTGDHVYFGSLTQPKIQRVRHDGTQRMDFFGVPPPDGGDVGIGLLENDCQALWGTRTGGDDLVTLSIASGALATAVAGVTQRTYDIVTDAKNVYVARADAGGVFAYNPNDGYVPVYRGNVFAMAVDDQGLYWGEHDLTTGGAMHMLVK